MVLDTENPEFFRSKEFRFVFLWAQKYAWKLSHDYPLEHYLGTLREATAKVNEALNDFMYSLNPRKRAFDVSTVLHFISKGAA